MLAPQSPKSPEAASGADQRRNDIAGAMGDDYVPIHNATSLMAVRRNLGPLSIEDRAFLFAKRDPAFGHDAFWMPCQINGLVGR